MIPLIYAVGRSLYNPVAGCIAALCLALSLVHIFYAQEIRMYSLICLLVLLSVLTLIRALEQNSRRWWILHWLVNTLMVWTHVFSVLQLVAEGCFLLVFHGRNWRRWVAWGIAHGAVVGSLVAWMAFMASRGVVKGAFWSPLPTVRELGNTFLIFVGGRFSNEDPTPYMTTHVSLDRDLAVLFLILGALLGLRTACGLLRGRADGRRKLESLGLLAMWLAIPSLVLMVTSFLYHPCFVYRYILHTSLPLYLIVGGAVAGMKRSAVAGLVVGLLVSIYTYQLVALPLPFRPDYRSAARLIRSSGTPLDYVITFKAINSIPFEFAADIPPARHESIHGFRELCKTVVARQRLGRNVWVVMWRWDDIETFERHLASNGLRFAVAELGGMPRLRVYCVYGTPPDEPPAVWQAWRRDGGLRLDTCVGRVCMASSECVDCDAVDGHVVVCGM